MKTNNDKKIQTLDGPAKTTRAITANHISVDVKHKFIRAYVVTSANVHDSNVYEELLDSNNSSKDIYADSAYRSQQAIESLKAQGYREHLQRKGSRNRKLSK